MNWQAPDDEGPSDVNGSYNPAYNDVIELEENSDEQFPIRSKRGYSMRIMDPMQTADPLVVEEFSFKMKLPDKTTPSRVELLLSADRQINISSCNDIIKKRGNQDISRSKRRLKKPDRIARRVQISSQKKSFIPSKHKYKLKLGKVGKLFVNNMKDPSLLRVLEEFDHFETWIDRIKRERLQSLGVSAVILLTRRDRTNSGSSSTDLHTAPISSVRNTKAHPIHEGLLARTVQQAKPMKQVHKPRTSLPLQPKVSKLKKKKSDIVPFLDDLSVEPTPKRKCISYDDGLTAKARESLMQRFKILSWRIVSDHEEQVVVVFNECVTLKIKLSLPFHGQVGGLDQWTVTHIDYRIFAMDHNVHSVLRACIDYIIDTYPTCDLLNFLGLLFIIHHDASEFYKQCRERFGSTIKVDNTGLVKIRLVENGSEVVLNIFTDELFIDNSKSIPRKLTAKPERNKNGRQSQYFRVCANANSFLCRGLGDILTATVRFVRATFEMKDVDDTSQAMISREGTYTSL